MTSRERVLLALQHQEADRVAVHDSPWSTTVERWHREGLPAEQSPAAYFGFEFHGAWVDNSLQLPTETIEDTDDYTVVKTGDGNIWRNWKGRMSTPELLDFTITSREIWEEHKPRMVMNDSRVNWEAALKQNRAAAEAGFFCHFSCGPGFTKVCDMVGPERLMMAMVDDPDWVRDMAMTDAELCVAIAEEMMARGFHFDAGWAFDDLGYKHRGFMSVEHYRELFWPGHKLIADCFKSRGLPMLLHSCGYVAEYIPLIIEAGYDLLQPLEVKAGMDLLKLKKQYGDRLTFMGGIDVRAMAHPDPKVIEEEIASKIPAAKQGGGYVFHSDHSVPDNVSFEQYERVIELVRKYGQY
jgi:uroporphyrinogen decarboxylase